MYTKRVILKGILFCLARGLYEVERKRFPGLFDEVEADPKVQVDDDESMADG